MEGMNTNIMDINRILDEARNLGCSDLHFTAGLPPVVRLHGSIRKLSGYPDCTEPIIVNIINQITSIKHKSQISKGLDTDFSYVSTAGFRHRVNVYRQRGYHAVAIRLLRNDIPTLADLSLPATLGEFAMAPRGLVLVTGPTGSGKSTTLAAMIDHINRSKNCHIITVEDPIEYLHTHKQSMVNQREIGQDVDSFAGSLRAALREDPDVILVGEMRDFETINAAVTAAETGHLVFSTLHTTGAAETIDRIIDVYPPHSQGQIRSQLANSVVGIISQTLVPTADGALRGFGDTRGYRRYPLHDPRGQDIPDTDGYRYRQEERHVHPRPGSCKTCQHGQDHQRGCTHQVPGSERVQKIPCSCLMVMI